MTNLFLVENDEGTDLSGVNSIQIQSEKCVELVDESLLVLVGRSEGADEDGLAGESAYC